MRRSLTPGGIFHPVSREGALVLNNLFLTTAAATVLVGTLYPLVVEALSADKISVGAPFFNLTFGPLMVPLLAMVPFGPLLAWKRGDLLAVAQRLMAAFGGALLAVLVTALFIDGASVLAALGVGLAAWLVLGALTDLALKAGIGSVPASTMLRRLAGLPRSVFGTTLAHLGLGLTTLGIVGVAVVRSRKHPDHEAWRDGRNRRPRAAIRWLIDPIQGPNYTEDRANFDLLDKTGAPYARVISAKRFYPVRQMPTTEAGIKTIGVSQLYVSLGDQTADGGSWCASGGSRW